MKVMKWMEILVLSFSLLVGFSTLTHADNDTVGEKVEEAGSDMKKNTSQGWRKVKDETCQWVKGKLECAGDKVKHKAKDAKDEVKDKVDAE
jgi:hypothetical protein